jgi:hypothetical protein
MLEEGGAVGRSAVKHERFHPQACDPLRQSSGVQPLVDGVTSTGVRKLKGEMRAGGQTPAGVTDADPGRGEAAKARPRVVG